MATQLKALAHPLSKCFSRLPQKRFSSRVLKKPWHSFKSLRNTLYRPLIVFALPSVTTPKVNHNYQSSIIYKNPPHVIKRYRAKIQTLTQQKLRPKLNAFARGGQSCEKLE